MDTKSTTGRSEPLKGTLWNTGECDTFVESEDCSEYIHGTNCKMILTRDIEQFGVSHIKARVVYTEGTN